MTAPNNRERIVSRLIDAEVKESFINYSMSVIVSRALPDVRDGLKPVHRRVLYAMNELGLVPGRPFKKSATVVGDVLGKYHPHGDSSVYDALVRMVQDFSLRYPLVDGQGNFGSVDGDSRGGLPVHRSASHADGDGDARGHRQGHRRLRRELRRPAAGAAGASVGHSESAWSTARRASRWAWRRTSRRTICARSSRRSCISSTKPDATPAEIRKLIKGPDFPTGGYIYGREGIKNYQETGRGRIVMRARAVIEEKESSNKSQIVVTEIPYQVNKARLVEQIADQVKDGKLEGISASARRVRSRRHAHRRSS